MRYDETDLVALRVDGWKMDICVKFPYNWFNPKNCPSVPYVVNPLINGMERITPIPLYWEAETKRPEMD